MIDFRNIKLDVFYSFFSIVFIQFVLKLFTVAGKLILARLLIPDYFGIFAVTLFIYTIFLHIDDLGLSASAIREEDFTYGNILFVQVLFAIILYVLLVAFRNVFLVFSDNVVQIIPLFMTNLIIMSISSAPSIYLSKEIKLSQLIIPRTVQIISDTAVSIILAYYYNLGIYALIYGKIVSNILYTILIWVKVYKIMPLNFDFSKIKKMIFSSKYFLILGFISIFSTDISKAILSIRFTDEIVGMFFTVWSFIFIISNLIEEPFRKVSYPYFSKFKNDIPKLSNFYYFITKITMAFEIPIYIFLFYNIPFFVSIIFPPQNWDYSILIPLFRISIFVCIFEPFSMYGFEILKTFKKENLIILVISLVTLFILVVGTAFTYLFEYFNMHGVLGMAFSHYFLIFISMITIYNIYLIFKTNFIKFLYELFYIYIIPLFLFVIFSLFINEYIYLSILIPIIYFLYYKLFFKYPISKIIVLVLNKNVINE